MNLKQLQSLQAQTQKKVEANGSKRLEKANTLFEDGLEKLYLAHEREFKDHQVLRDSVTDLIEAIKHNRKDVRPYVFLSYIFALIEDYEVAEEYLYGALELEPENPIVKAFQQTLIEQKRAILSGEDEASEINEQLEVGLFGSSDPISDQDYDELYDSLEAYIARTVKKVMANPVPSIAGSSKTIEVMESMITKLSKYQEHIEDQLEIVDEEIDISDLEKMAKPLFITLRNLENALRISREFHKVKHSIMKITKASKAFYKQVQAGQADIAKMEQSVEKMLDRSDSLADQLDIFEEKRYPSESLVTLYEEMIKNVVKLQDELDTLSLPDVLPGI